MTELKTLKDINIEKTKSREWILSNTNLFDICSKERLRFEAIKWMVYDFKNVCDFDTLTERWMKRFNLTNQDVFIDGWKEDDLK